MISRTTWILLGLFIILLAGTWLWQRREIPVDEGEPTPTPMPMLFELVPEQVRDIRIESVQGDHILLSRLGASWITTEPERQNLDEQIMVGKLNQLVLLRALNKLSVPPSEDQLGLDKPAYTITITDDDSKDYILEVGVQTPTQSGYYVRMDESIYVISSLNIDELVDLLDNPPIVISTPTSTDVPGVPGVETATSTVPPVQVQTATP